MAEMSSSCSLLMELALALYKQEDAPAADMKRMLGLLGVGFRKGVTRVELKSSLLEALNRR